MGSDPDIGFAACQELYYKPEGCQQNWYDDEAPVSMVMLDSYYIDKYEVTNAKYQACVDEGTCTPPSNTGSWSRDDYYGNSEFTNYPVIYVNWNQANTFCQWRGGRLPTEAEWEKAARGTDERQYPWGNTFDGNSVNFYDTNCGYDWANKDYDDGYADTALVGSYPNGISPYGVHDMAGNVWEWTGSIYKPYPYNPGDSREDTTLTNVILVLRGGSWGYSGFDVRTPDRGGRNPDVSFNIIGFRCSRSY